MVLGGFLDPSWRDTAEWPARAAGNHLFSIAGLLHLNSTAFATTALTVRTITSRWYSTLWVR